MPLDSRLVPFLADSRNHVRRPPAHVPIAKVRQAANAAMLGMTGPAMHEAADIVCAVDGRRIPLRLYRPVHAPVLPLVVFAHGGGFVWGSLDTHDAICRFLASGARAAVLAVDYGLAPETPAAGQVDDVFDALRWARASSAALGIDPSRIALCGDSAGAALALAAALRARDTCIPIAHLAMIYPALDPDCATRSHQEFGEGYMLTRDAMRWFWQMHLGTGAAPAGCVAPVAIPLERLRDLPPVSLSVAEFDILRDEGCAFAQRLAEAGVAVCLRRHAGMIHGFLSLAPVAAYAAATLATIGADIAGSFETVQSA